MTATTTAAAARTSTYPSTYLLDMPARVLFGEARAVERWCAENEKCRPTLLDLGEARRWRSSERPR